MSPTQRTTSLANGNPESSAQSSAVEPCNPRSPQQDGRLLAALENARVLPYPRSPEHKDLHEPYAKSTTSGRSTGDPLPRQRWSSLLPEEEEEEEDMGEVDYESLPTDNLWQHLLAGGMAGMMEHCFMYPVDCVKVYTLVGSLAFHTECLDAI